MLSEKLKQLAATFADAVSEVVETEMRDRMTNALSALGATGGSGDTEVRRGRPAKTSKEKTGKSKSGRLARRSLEEIQAVVADVVKLVAKHPDGLRSETIRTELDLDVREVPRVLKEGLTMGALKSTGQKRATVYFAGKGSKTPKAKKASSKKTPKAKAASKKAPKKAAKKNKAKAASKKTKAKVSKSANGAAGHATAEATA
jgi:glucan-binding YG repeat protein